MQGLKASLLGAIPYSAVRLGSYDGLKWAYKKVSSASGVLIWYAICACLAPERPERRGPHSIPIPLQAQAVSMLSCLACQLHCNLL